MYIYTQFGGLGNLNSRKWVYLFISTLILGGLSTIVVGFAVKWGEYAELFQAGEILEILSITFWLLGVGFIFSLISQMGFFAYLTIHRFGLGVFRSLSLWNAVQIVLIAFVVFDLIYLRLQVFGGTSDSVGKFVIPGVLILIYGIIIATIKMKQTNKGAFVPALFFMVVVSILEWFPALRANESDWLLLMIFPLLICNTWQLLTLHKLTKK